MQTYPFLTACLKHALYSVFVSAGIFSQTAFATDGTGQFTPKIAKAMPLSFAQVP